MIQKAYRAKTTDNGSICSINIELFIVVVELRYHDRAVFKTVYAFRIFLILFGLF